MPLQFFFQSLVADALQLFGPIKQVHENSKFYSGVRPTRLSRYTEGGLPHVTIQMPVYKEGLDAVIVPTIRSLKAAIATYEMQGGTVNIFVNDDGLQLVDADTARARLEFYDEQNIGWVARPKHNSNPAEGEEVFLRRGKFKKASNMNYAMSVSCRVEEKLFARQLDSWTSVDEAMAYGECLREVCEEDEGRTWADGKYSRRTETGPSTNLVLGNVRFGDYILLIDSDTRVPRDCLLDCVSEMQCNPQCGIVQYASGVMNVTDCMCNNILLPIDVANFITQHTLSAVSHSSPISSTLRSSTPLPVVMLHLSSDTMPFSVGAPSSTLATTASLTVVKSGGM